jgi:hypothetical protein
MEAFWCYFRILGAKYAKSTQMYVTQRISILLNCVITLNHRKYQPSNKIQGNELVLGQYLVTYAKRKAYYDRTYMTLLIQVFLFIIRKCMTNRGDNIHRNVMGRLCPLPDNCDKGTGKLCVT